MIEYSDTKLLAILPVQIGHDHYENPFKADVLRDVPDAFELARRWARLHWSADLAEVENRGAVDPFEAMEEALALKRSGFHRADGPQGFALFPNVPKGSAAEADWETKCIAMHSEQKPILLQEKPDTNIEDFVRLKRGD